MANIDLLRHEMDRFGVVTVMDATIYDYEKGTALLTLDTLKISNISAEGQEKQITGGKYADLLLTYNFGRSVTLEFQDALISPASMKQLWGATQSAANKAHGYEVFKDSTAGVVTIAKANATVLGVTNLTQAINYSKLEWVQDGAEVEITPATPNPALVATDDIRVDYTYPVAVGAELVITSASFPKTVKLVGKTFVLNQSTGQEVDIEIEVPKLKLASNFTMTLDAEGDASVFDFSGMALIDGANKELFKIRTLG